MDYSGTFPFGWIRNFENDNWQLIWNKNTKEFFVKSVSSKEIKVLDSFNNWKEAKDFADTIIENPKILER